MGHEINPMRHIDNKQYLAHYYLRRPDQAQPIILVFIVHTVTPFKQISGFYRTFLGPLLLTETNYTSIVLFNGFVITSS